VSLVWFALAARRLFSAGALKHLVVVVACALALWIQMLYRVPGTFLFLLLPWVSFAVLGLQLVFFIRYVFVPTPEALPLASTWHHVERVSGIMVRIFVYYSVLLFANGALDSGPVEETEASIGQVRGTRLDLGIALPYSWAGIRPAQEPARTDRVLLRPDEWRMLWEGQQVLVPRRPGAFGLPWIVQIEHDQAKYYEAVIKTAPDAKVARRQLIQFYLQHRRWPEANRASREYVERWPDDYEFLQYVAKFFGGHGRFADMLVVLEPFAKRNADYEVYNLTGLSLWRVGRTQEAARMLEAAIPMDPDNWWAEYFLGYVYGALGRTGDAITAFERVLRKRPDFPEVRRELAQLRQLDAVKRAARDRAMPGAPPTPAPR